MREFLYSVNFQKTSSWFSTGLSLSSFPLTARIFDYKTMHYSVTFALSLAVYTKTLMPSIPGGDSGELVAESCELGTAHPPGYPLYTLVVHLLTYVPIGTMAWRANFFCAVLGALAAANIARCVFMLTSNDFSMIPNIFKGADRWERHSSSVCAGLMYAFSPLVWTYSIGSEVFAMNNFFASLLVVLTLNFATQTTTAKRDEAAVLGAFVCGLAMCNQHTQILFQIPLFMFVFWSSRATMSRLHFITLTVSYVLGLLPYMYLPVASIYFPKRGAWGDMSSWMGFFRHLRRADYGTFQLYSRNDQTEGLSERLAAHAWDYAERQSLWCVGPILSLVGVACCCQTALKSCGRGRKIRNNSLSPKKVKREEQGVDASPTEFLPETKSEPIQAGVALVCFFVFYELGFHSLSNLPLDNKLLFGIHARFWMQPNVLLFVWLGIGLVWIAQQVRVYSLDRVTIVASALSILLVALQLWRWTSMMDQSSNNYLEGYARGILESLPPKSLFFTNYDQQWTASRYLHVCEHVRPDVPFINLSMMTFWWFHRQRALFPEISFPKRCNDPACGSYLAGENTAQHKRGEAFTFKELLDANVKRFPGGECMVLCGCGSTPLCLFFFLSLSLL